MLRFCDKWWMTAGRGAIAAVFGLAVLFLPGLDHRTLAVALGVFAFVDGLLLAALAVVARHTLDQWWLVLVESCVSFAVAAVALVWMTDDALSLLAVLAAWAVVTGVLEVEAGVRLGAWPLEAVSARRRRPFAGARHRPGGALRGRRGAHHGVDRWFVLAYGGALGIVAFRLRRLAAAERTSRG